MEMGNNIENNNTIVWKYDDKNHEKFMACFILSAVGDIVGYNNGKWEFNYKCNEIHREFNKITNNKGMSGL
jgi:hypothetical protein